MIDRHGGPRREAAGRGGGPRSSSPPRQGLAAALLALCLLAPAARADTVLEWNEIALRTTAAAPFNPPLETRTLAIVHAAMFDAVDSITGEFWPYRVHVGAPPGASAEAAAAAAAHRTLVRLFPEQQATLDEALQASLALLVPGRSTEDGAAVGVEVADRLLEARAGDGAAEAVAQPYQPPGGVGGWVPTPPAFRPALDPGWGAVTPFLLRSGSQYRPGPPPRLRSRAYARDLAEVRELGASPSASRTPAQTDLARLWVATAPQVWNPVARQAVAAAGLGLSASARLLALLNLAGADAFIAAWDAKFTYQQWRPVTGIRAAAQDGNPETDGDPSWTPLLATPPFPDYVAGHTVYAGAVARVLAGILGERPGPELWVASGAAPGVRVGYSSFEDIARGVVEARVWGGVHWRTSAEVGKRLGERIGRHALRHALRPAQGQGVLAGERKED